MKIFSLLLLLLRDSHAQFDDTAALILGGYSLNREGGPIRNEAELFGCPGSPSIVIDSYPKQVTQDVRVCVPYILKLKL